MFATEIFAEFIFANEWPKNGIFCGINFCEWRLFLRIYRIYFCEWLIKSYQKFLLFAICYHFYGPNFQFILPFRSKIYCIFEFENHYDWYNFVNGKNGKNFAEFSFCEWPIFLQFCGSYFCEFGWKKFPKNFCRKHFLPLIR